MSDYKRFSLEQWEEVENEALQKYRKNLGKRPNRRSVSKEVADTDSINGVYMIGMIILLFATIFTSYKVWFASAPYAEALAQTLAHGAVDPFWLSTFKVFTGIMAVLAGTVGLIYMKIFADNRATIEKRKETQRNSKFSLEYWSPRLPSVLVYAIMLYLIFVSNVANSSIVDVLMTNIIVVMELALAHPVAVILTKRQKRAEAITQSLHQRQHLYDQLFNSYSVERDYLVILFQTAREAFFDLGKKHKRDTSLNEKLRYADPALVEQLVGQEYQRLRGGNIFSSTISQWQNADHSKRPLVAKVSSELIEATLDNGAKRIPPRGRDKWTHDTLYNDLIAYDAPKEISEAWLAEHYEAGRDVRKVWRNTLKREWNNR